MHLSRNAVSLSAAVVLVALGLFVANAVAGAPDLLYKEFTQGANTAWSDCPWDAPPSDGAICRTYSVLFARLDATDTRGAIDQARAPLAVFFDIVTERYHADSDSFDLVADEFGDTTDVTGSYDAARLSFAQLDTAQHQWP
jgi:hypothetical protein